MRAQITEKSWFALAGGYGSGLPVELDSDEEFNLLLSQYGPAILAHVSLDRGRVRPSFSFDASAGAQLYRKEQRSASLEIQGTNLLNRVNVTNFASLFSGTAVAPPRSVLASMRLTF
jgi:hypothetical protein